MLFLTTQDCRDDTYLPQIQLERVRCLCELKELVQTAIAKLDASVKAILNVSTAKSKVGFFLMQFRQAKNAYDEAEVRM